MKEIRIKLAELLGAISHSIIDFIDPRSLQEHHEALSKEFDLLNDRHNKLINQLEK